MSQKKATDTSKIRKLQEELRKTKKLLVTALDARDKYKAQGDALEIVLDEARRRTIPFRGSIGRSLNFLPLCITEYKTERAFQTHQGADGSMLTTYGEVEVLIRAIGRVVEHKE